MTTRISPSNLTDQLVLALANKLPSPRASVNTDDMVQCLADYLNIGLDDWGIVESQASKPTWVRYNAIRGMRFVKSAGLSTSPSRGRYGLSQKGWERATELGHTPTQQVVEETPSATDDDVVVETPVAVVPTENHGVGVGVALSELLPSSLEDNYHPDEYIKSLGIASAKCFGFHADRSPTCASCPLAKSCRSAWLRDLSALAVELDKASQQPVEEPKEEEVVEEEEVVQEPEVQTRPNRQNSGTKVKLPTEANCKLCGVTIPKGAEAMVEFGTEGVACVCCP